MVAYIFLHCFLNLLKVFFVLLGFSFLLINLDRFNHVLHHLRIYFFHNLEPEFMFWFEFFWCIKIWKFCNFWIFVIDNIVRFNISMVPLMFLKLLQTRKAISCNISALNAWYFLGYHSIIQSPVIVFLDYDMFSFLIVLEQINDSVNILVL